MINFDFLKNFDKIIKNQKCRKIKSKKSKKRLLVALTQPNSNSKELEFFLLLNQFYDYTDKLIYNKNIPFSEILHKLSSWKHKVKKSNKNPNGRGVWTVCILVKKFIYK